MGHGQSRAKMVQKKLKLSQSEADDMLKQFFQMTGNSNNLTRAQFHTIMQKSVKDKDYDKELYDTVFDMLDLNKDGTVDFYEFSISMVYSAKLPMDKRIDYLFRMMDFDGNGQVSAQEMDRVIRTGSRISDDAERVWNLEEYFPTLAKKDFVTKKEFREAMKTPKGQELMNCLDMRS